MKHPALLIALGLGLVARLAGAEPPLEFTGVLVFPDKTLIALKTPADGTSKFLEPGGAFAGYMLVSYEPKDETVVVARDGATFRLRLREAKVQSAAPVDLRTQSLDERRRVWALIKDLEGQALIDALIAHGDREMRASVERTAAGIAYLQQMKAKIAADGLREPNAGEEQPTKVATTVSQVEQRVKYLQSAMDRQAALAKYALGRSLKP